MTTYFSTFIPGANAIIERLLVSHFSDITIDYSLDGLIVYTTSASQGDIKQLRGISNSFILVKQFNNAQKNTIEKLLKQVLGEPKILKAITHTISPKQFTFRIVTSEDNHNVSANQALISQMEERLSQRSHLKPNRRNPQNEIWFITRSEGYSFIGIKLTKNINIQAALSKGEISPDLAHLLCFLSEPSKEDIVLDPFAGTGAITIERTNNKANQIIAVEKDPELLQVLTEKITRLNKNIRIEKGDPANLKEIPSQSVGKIITSLASIQSTNIPVPYNKILSEFIRIINPSGIVIILTTHNDELSESLHSLKDRMSIIEQFSILVSGKKASIYKLRVIN